MKNNYQFSLCIFLAFLLFPFLSNADIINIQTLQPTGIQNTSATLCGLAESSIGMISRGFEYKENEETTYSSVVVTTTGQTYSYTLNNLFPNTSYQYRSFMNINGTLIYGDVVSFTTIAISYESKFVSKWDGLSHSFTKGNGTEASPYLIEDAGQLAYLSSWINVGQYQSSYFKLTRDIDLNNLSWTPIGIEAYPFSGNFDGDGHIIYNLKIDDPSLTDVGLFGYMQRGTIRNLGIGSGLISTGTIAGGIVGRTYGLFWGISYPYPTNSGYATISNCFNKANITTTATKGGIIGHAKGNTNVSNCFNKGDIGGSGIVGYCLNYQYFSYTYNTFWGYVNINSCYNSGLVSTPVTGVAGTNYLSIANCYYLNTSCSSSGYATSMSQNMMNSTPFVTALGSSNWTQDSLPFWNNGYPFPNIFSQQNVIIDSIYLHTPSAVTFIAEINPRFSPGSFGFEYKRTNLNTYTDIPLQGSVSQFSHLITNLYPNTSYDVRPYIVVNNVKYYGQEKQFTTLTAPITINYIEICQGEQYEFHHTQYQNSGTYETLYNDTIHKLILVVRPTYNDTLRQSICSGEQYRFGATDYSVQGTYIQSLTSQYGCDSVVTLILTVDTIPLLSIIGDSAICQGETTTITASGGASYLWSTGQNTAAINVNESGRYTVTATNSQGCSSQMAVSVIVNPIPNITISGNTSICQGASTTLTAAGADSYQWNTDNTDSGISVSSEGTYSVTGTNTNGCTATANAVVTVNPISNTSISQAICQGTSYTFHGQQLTDAGTYSHTLQSSKGCDSVITLLLTVDTIPLLSIIGDSAICQGETTTITASGGASYLWSTGQNTAAINVNESGRYTVTATNSQGCSSQMAVSVVVNPLPNITISGNTTICQGSSTTLTAAGADTYQWNTDNTGSGISVSSEGTYSVTGTNTNGCTATANAVVTVNPISNTSISQAICQGTSYTFHGQQLTDAGTYSHTLQSSKGCDSVITLLLTVDTIPLLSIIGDSAICQGETTTITASGGASYLWSTGQNTAAINVNESGRYTVTATNSQGCSSQMAVSVVVNPLPNITISGNTTICQGSSTTLTAAGADTYQWNTDNTGSGISVSSEGTYSVTGTNTNGCTATANAVVTVNPISNTSISQAICQGTSYTFHGQQLTDAGTYSHTLQSSKGCDSVITLLLTVDTIPLLSIIGDSAICQGETTTITASGGASYLWSTGQNTAAINVNESGRYTVTATNSQGCSSQMAVSVVVNPLPNITISGNTTICQGSSTTLTAAGADTYQWNTDNTGSGISVSSEGTYSVTGTTTNGCTSTANVVVTVNPIFNTSISQVICQGASYTFYGQQLTDAGTYSHTLQSSKGCDSVITLLLTVDTIPLLSIIGDSAICQGETTTITASGGASYLWSTGQNTAAINVNESGRYTVTATNSQGCSSQMAVSVVVNPLPNITISGNTTICQGSSTTLTAAGADTYQWNTDNTGSGISVSSEGTYSVTGTNTNGCTATANAVVTVNPISNTSISQAICQGTSYTFHGQQLTDAGTYSHTLQSSKGCDSVITLLLTVDTIPLLSIIGDSAICQGETTTITASGGASYLWSTGQNTAAINVNESGRYTVTATNSQGCSSQMAVSVVVNPLPNITISGNTTICQGSSTTLTAAGADTYQWNTDNTGSGISVSSEGTYSVTGTTTNGCTSTANVVVTVNPIFNTSISQVICQGASYTFYGQQLTDAGTYSHTLQSSKGCDSVITLLLTVDTIPLLSIIGDSAICQGETTTITASGGASYLWSTGQNTAAINVNESGRYTVTATNSQGCSSQMAVSVVVNPLPNITISGNTTICQGSSTTLTAAGADTYQWNTDNTGSGISVSSEGTYSVTGTNTNGCTATANAVVTVNPISNTSISQAICQGTSYTFHGQQLTDAGTYSHTLQSSKGCDSVITLLLTVDTIPLLSIIGDSAICQGETTTITASGGASYLWSTGQNTAAINVNESGRYTVTATNSQGCSSQIAVSVVVNPIPNITISGNTTICQGSFTTLTATGADSYQWNTDNTGSGISVSSEGTYSVTGTTTNGCTAAANVVVTVNPIFNTSISQAICQGASYTFYGQQLTDAGTYSHTLQSSMGCDSVITLLLTVDTIPLLSISGDSAICQGESTTITASGGASYLWSTGQNTAAINVHESGRYTVTATNSQGCSSQMAVSVIVNPIPNITISGNTTICQGSSTTLTAAGADTYQWNTGETTSGIVVSSFGIYSVVGTTNEGCVGTANISLYVYPNPTITIMGDTVLCQGESIILTAYGGNSYLWSTGDTLQSLEIEYSGSYSVIGYNNYGCSSMATKNVVLHYPSSSEFSITESGSYTWNNQTYNQSGDYIQVFESENGCDSTVTLHLTITQGIEDGNIISSVVIYPNPTTGVTSISCDNVIRTDVYNNIGQLISTFTNTSIIDLTKFPSGQYIFRIVLPNSIVIRKIIKQ